MPSSDLVTLDDIRYQPLTATGWCATATISTTIIAPVILWPQLLSPLPSQLALYPNHRSTVLSTIDITRVYWKKVSQQQPLSVLEVAYHKRQQQRNGVRLLLKNLLKKLNIIDDLNDSAFPYRLSHTGYYVCFSHSDDHSQRFSRRTTSSACFQYNLLSKVAVAISLHRAVGIDIETQLIAWPTVQRYYHTNELSLLLALPESNRAIIAKYLWQLKESFIKINNDKLAQGLGIDYSHLIPILHAKLSTISPVSSLIEGDAPATIFIKLEADIKTSYRLAILRQQQALVIF